MEQIIPNPDTQDVALTFKVPRSLSKHIRIQAAHREISVSELIRDAVKAFIGEPEADASPDPGDTQEN